MVSDTGWGEGAGGYLLGVAGLWTEKGGRLGLRASLGQGRRRGSVRRAPSRRATGQHTADLSGDWLPLRRPRPNGR